MSSEYGQVFRMNYTAQRGFHVILMIPNKSCVQDFPDELEVARIPTIHVFFLVFSFSFCILFVDF